MQWQLGCEVLPFSLQLWQQVCALNSVGGTHIWQSCLVVLIKFIDTFTTVYKSTYTTRDLRENSTYTKPFHSMGRWCYIFQISPNVGLQRSEPRNYTQKSRKKIYKHMTLLVTECIKQYMYMTFLRRLTQDCTASRFKLSVSGDTQTLHSKREYQVLYTNSALQVGMPWQTHTAFLLVTIRNTSQHILHVTASENTAATHSQWDHLQKYKGTAFLICLEKYV